MKKQNAKRYILSWGLLISLMLPMLLDSLHYVIFHHHDEEGSTASLQFQNHEESHILCSFPFVTEEFTNNAISVSPSERIISFYFATKIFSIAPKRIFSNPLRGPPLES